MLSTENLRNLIAKKHQVLMQLRDVGQQQIELIGGGQVTQLLDVLAAKQKLITALQDVERELEPFRSEDPDARQWQTPQRRADCAKQATECNQLLSEVVYLEKQSEDKMVSRRDEVADQLQRAYSASQARGAYTAHQAHKPEGNQPHASTPPLEDLSKTPGGLDLVSGT